MNELYALELSEERLCELGARLGSDIPFCLLITLIMLIPALIKRRFYRWQGAASLSLYILYMILLYII